MWRHANRMAALLGQSCIVDDQPSAVATDLSVGFGKQRHLERFLVPYAAGNEMMQPVVADIAVARRHRLYALVIPRADQSRDIGRTHPRTRLVPQGRYKRRQPFIQCATPIRLHRQPPEKLAPYESPDSSLRNPRNITINRKSAKVVLVQIPRL